MPRKNSKKAKRTVPPWGRAEKDVQKDIDPGLRAYSHDVPLGNNDPTVVRATLFGGMPNDSRMARGKLTTYRGKYT